jgi:hypothetical protein
VLLPLAGGVAVVVALVAIGLVSGMLRFGSGDESPLASASAAGASAAGADASPASDAATAAPGGIVAGGLVEATVGELPVMEVPGVTGQPVGALPAGQRAYVADGPVERDGSTWFLLSGLGLPPNTGCEVPYSIADCPSWIGWAPSTIDGRATLKPAGPSCPDMTDYRDFANQPPLTQLVCAGDDRITLTAWWAGRPNQATCIDAPPGVDWLYCALALSGWLAPSPDEVGATWLAVAVDPSSGVTLPVPGQWVKTTGHFDDAAAAACSVVPGAPDAELGAWAQVLQCRSTLVVDSMVEASQG